MMMPARASDGSSSVEEDITARSIMPSTTRAAPSSAVMEAQITWTMRGWITSDESALGALGVPMGIPCAGAVCAEGIVGVGE
ncbi:hypothetical protein MANAM107_17180 [Actinomyces capricornis]|uniref:Uncharacterized protein n=1 Tax=Actinomyces capricornis TaxID=2755559 RepID=A0ABM7UP03_9ACTO|nr:hypothetical protein MANAM107_17180 [Actinomyces capricornis]